MRVSPAPSALHQKHFLSPMYILFQCILSCCNSIPEPLKSERFASFNPFDLVVTFMYIAALCFTPFVVLLAYLRGWPNSNSHSSNAQQVLSPIIPFTIISQIVYALLTTHSQSPASKFLLNCILFLPPP